MSYCRWSSDGFKSAVYVYESVGDFWAIHVAGRKKVGLETLPPDPMNYDLMQSMGDKWQQYYKDWGEAYDKLEWEDLPPPHAGETFHAGSPAECSNILLMLKGKGYHIPEGVIEELQKEQAELDSNYVAE